MKRQSTLAMAIVLSTALSTAFAATDNIHSVAVQVNSAMAGETSLDAAVEAVRQATLSTQVPGAIVALHVKPGDSVRAGQALLQIDARAAQQQVAGSTAQLDAAQAAQRVAANELERQKQLFQKQYIM